jgi:hypothetical protein
VGQVSTRGSSNLKGADITLPHQEFDNSRQAALNEQTVFVSQSLNKSIEGLLVPGKKAQGSK